ncbi:MAG: glycoside hydrolase family 3 N-terminal domain-containing protein, partial [Actinomycetota bacterium]
DPSAWADFGALPYADTSAPLVMTGHIRYAGVDGGAPASLSPVITGWLRNDLGYDGVIVTDDMHVMRGVGSELTPGQRAVAAIRAGADLALFVGAIDAADIVQALVDEASIDAAFAARLEESAERVLRLKGALGLIPGASAEWFDWCGGVSSVEE